MDVRNRKHHPKRAGQAVRSRGVGAGAGAGRDATLRRNRPFPGVTVTGRDMHKLPLSRPLSRYLGCRNKQANPVWRCANTTGRQTKFCDLRPKRSNRGRRKQPQGNKKKGEKRETTATSRKAARTLEEIRRKLTPGAKKRDVGCREGGGVDCCALTPRLQGLDRAQVWLVCQSPGAEGYAPQ